MVKTILDDPAYQGGNYTTEPALKLANLFGNLVVTTPEYRNQATPRDKLDEFFFAEAESPQSIDANDRLWQLRAIMTQDVIGNRTLAEAARAATPKFLVIVAPRTTSSTRSPRSTGPPPPPPPSMSPTAVAPTSS